MRRPSAAIAWQLWSRDRWWITAAVVYFLAISMAAHLMPQGSVWNAATWYLASPLAVGLLGLLAVFSYGSGMDLATCESGFPTRMCTLPMSSRALAGWPMLYGVMTLAVVWPAVALLIIRPRGVEVPLCWPAVAAAGFLAWFQVICWSGFGFPWLRLVVSVAVLGPYVILAVLGARYGVSEGVLAVLFAVQLPVAYGLAVVGVSRARRGDVPDWRGLVRWAGVAASSGPRRRFASAHEAQTWFEWRLSGHILPAQMCLMLLFFSVFVVIVRLVAEGSSRDLSRLPLALARCRWTWVGHQPICRWQFSYLQRRRRRRAQAACRLSR